MGFHEVLDQVVALLRQRGRVTYRALKHKPSWSRWRSARRRVTDSSGCPRAGIAAVCRRIASITCSSACAAASSAPEAFARSLMLATPWARDHPRTLPVPLARMAVYEAP
jgi:hypothetical protein